jgi:PIN domain
VPANFILVDFENVRPKNLELLAKHPVQVYVFVGANQAKVPFDLAMTLQELGERGRYIKIDGSGRNALDFHIAYYLGELASQHPDAYFHIISKDTGFDPLVRYLRGRKIRIQREKDLAEVPVLGMSTAVSSEEKITAIVKNLEARGHSKPRKVKTLANAINSLFSRNLEEAELMALVNELKQRKLIAVSGDKVTYHLER